MGLPRLGGLEVKAGLKARAGTRRVQIMVVTGAETRDLDPTVNGFRRYSLSDVIMTSPPKRW